LQNLHNPFAILLIIIHLGHITSHKILGAFRAMASHQHGCDCDQHPSGGTIISALSLRAKQGPIKDAYKQDASKALITLSSEGTLSNTSIACKLSTGAAVKEAKSRVAGLHPMAGGDEPGISGKLCSGDMLFWKHWWRVQE
jgi:prephenate dehydrogenase